MGPPGILFGGIGPPCILLGGIGPPGNGFGGICPPGNEFGGMLPMGGILLGGIAIFEGILPAATLLGVMAMLDCGILLTGGIIPG